ncbi:MULTISPECIES: fasciclin domain-containing protein [unclassified Tenacibaculum]|uniref:fasciclin domain-containing protein n=1 Tax=unclassified Tenacibaculum TaxID=2635139 RepID=UPI001F3A8C07|nr:MULTISPECIES: fasciclin domain-containing protein [unclassified Tenacibaculum]MCF2875847.1 fasciclin domain-containing protein [Tenacibaculum sp. Cn5-1]MCF2935922.1 fasciclin domain-containing protein [Tenacibaculum sp. Cn5-34]MCG7512483.1 fasciclin domain-containing protein [Tenacibaculum sp. Cn5-46]
MKIKIPLLSFILLVFFISCKETKNEASYNDTKATTTVHKGQAAVVDKDSEANALQVAKSLDDFKTLVVAVKAAGVEDALVNAGPLTVFAPINTAFDKLPEGTVETLLKPENKSQLAFVLKNHVAPANYPIKTLEKNVRKNRKLYMASGKYLDVTKQGNDLYVGNTKILKSVKVSNGWVHVIGDVLVPKDN